MDRLPVEFREILVLRHLEGLSYNEIAEIAQLAPGIVMSRLARARGKLKESLGARMQITGPCSLRGWDRYAFTPIQLIS